MPKAVFPSRKRPAPAVLEWMKRIEEDLQFVFVLTIGEIRKGIEKVTDDRRRAMRDNWFRTNFPRPNA